MTSAAILAVRPAEREDTAQPIPYTLAPEHQPIAYALTDLGVIA